MSDFLELTLEDGTKVLFQTAESDLVKNHGGEPEIKEADASIQRLQTIAVAADSMCQTFRQRLKPDELSMEISVGVSGEVGWFFAKTEAEASIKVNITWKSVTSGGDQ